MNAGYRGRAAPCQRERSDRALDRVAAIDNQSLRRFSDTRKCPPFGLLAEVVPQQPRAGNRPVSGARPALRGDNRETSGHGVETECGRPPPTGTTAIRGKHSTVPCVFTPGLHGLPALSRVLDLPCVTGRRGMSAFSRDLYFSTGRTNPPSAQLRGRGPELPLNRHGHVIERLLGLDAIAPSPGC